MVDWKRQVTEIEKIIEPVKDWYQSDEIPDRPLSKIITDIVSDLQDDRKQMLRIPQMEAQIYIPGIFQCAKCKFQLIKSVLNYQAGTITADDKKGDKCPNDGSPLWRVTYKDQYAEIMQISERICDEKIALEAERDKLKEALNSPETQDFVKGASLEAAHQRERWGSSHDEGKAPLDWFWLIGYLSQKAATSAISGDLEKAKHHTISTAAALANWHLALSGSNNQMRPGVETLAALKGKN